MSDLLEPQKVFIFGSILFNRKKITRDKVISLWEDRFQSDLIFNEKFCPMMEYYSKEMGDVGDLERFFIVSFELLSRKELVHAKIWADYLEKEYLDNGKRVFNLDIGQISLEQIILATGKSYSHRVYISGGVWADLTYQFIDKSYQSLEWTYPDYKRSNLIEKFNFCRKMLLEKLSSIHEKKSKKK